MSDIYLHGVRVSTLRLKYMCFYDGFQHNIAPRPSRLLHAGNLFRGHLSIPHTPTANAALYSAA